MYLLFGAAGVPTLCGAPARARAGGTRLAPPVWAQHIAFYDDALLFKPDQILLPFLRQVMQRGLEAHFHTPNALNARFITKDMRAAWCKQVFGRFIWALRAVPIPGNATGGKVYAHELERAVEHLVSAGADIRQITAYLIMAHPQTDQQDIEASMYFAHGLGLRLMLSNFPPSPARLTVNAVASGSISMSHCGTTRQFSHWCCLVPQVQRLKELCRTLNGQLEAVPRLSTVP